MEIAFGGRSSEIFGPVIETEKTFTEPLIASRSLTCKKNTIQPKAKYEKAI